MRIPFLTSLNGLLLSHHRPEELLGLLLCLPGVFLLLLLLFSQLLHLPCPGVPALLDLLLHLSDELLVLGALLVLKAESLVLEEREIVNDRFRAYREYPFEVKGKREALIT